MASSRRLWRGPASSPSAAAGAVHRRCALVFFQVGCSIGTLLAAGRADQQHYTLFNPTPRGQMREFSADRPDLTESPYTMDAGHFQIEMDVVNYSSDRENSVLAEAFGIAPIK